MSHYYGIFILALLFQVAGLLLKVYGDSKVKRNLRAAIDDERKKANRLIKSQEREFNSRIAAERCKLQQQFGVNPTRVEEEKKTKRFDTPRHISNINKTTRRHIYDNDDVTDIVTAVVMADILTDDSSHKGNCSDYSSSSSCLSDSGGSDCSCSCSCGEINNADTNRWRSIPIQRLVRERSKKERGYYERSRGVT